MVKERVQLNLSCIPSSSRDSIPVNNYIKTTSTQVLNSNNDLATSSVLKMDLGM